MLTISISLNNKKIKVLKNNLIKRYSKSAKSFLIATLICFFVMSLTQKTTAQRSLQNDRETKSFSERIFVGAYINSPFLGATQAVGNIFSVGIQPFAAYKWNEYIATGLTVNYDYTFNWFPGATPGSNSSRSFSDVGATTFARATIANTVILQIEGGYYSIERATTGFETERRNFPVSFVGAGYTNGSYEFLLSYELLGNLAFYSSQIPFDYKAGLVYHF